MFDLETKREVAKIGMVTTLGLTVATAMKMKGKNKKIHIGAGFAFVGFAFWHHMLYQNKNTKKKITKTPNKTNKNLKQSNKPTQTNKEAEA